MFFHLNTNFWHLPRMLLVFRNTLCLAFCFKLLKLQLHSFLPCVLFGTLTTPVPQGCLHFALLNLLSWQLIWPKQAFQKMPVADVLFTNREVAVPYLKLEVVFIFICITLRKAWESTYKRFVPRNRCLCPGHEEIHFSWIWTIWCVCSDLEIICLTTAVFVIFQCAEMLWFACEVFYCSSQKCCR